MRHRTSMIPCSPRAPNAGSRLRTWRKLEFTAACIEAGLIEELEVDGKIYERPKSSPYDMRHFYASMLIESQVIMKRVQKLMGHTIIATTLSTYGHLIGRAGVGDKDRIGPLARLDQIFVVNLWQESPKALSESHRNLPSKQGAAAFATWFVASLIHAPRVPG